MFGLGTWEIILILGVGLIVLGPDKLPTVARKLGKSVRDLRRAANDFSREIQREGLDETDTLSPPDGAQAHGDLPDEKVEDEGGATTKDHTADTPTKDLEKEPLEVDPTEPPNGAETESDAADAGPYAELYDPRAQRTQDEDTNVPPSSDQGKPPSA